VQAVFLPLDSMMAKETVESMKGLLYKVYCYRGSDKLIWYEVEDCTTGEGVAWSPDRTTVISKAEKLGYLLSSHNDPVIKFYRAKAS
jgi:hypothetical protein